MEILFIISKIEIINKNIFKIIILNLKIKIFILYIVFILKYIKM